MPICGRLPSSTGYQHGFETLAHCESLEGDDVEIEGCRRLSGLLACNGGAWHMMLLLRDVDSEEPTPRDYLHKRKGVTVKQRRRRSADDDMKRHPTTCGKDEPFRGAGKMTRLRGVGQRALILQPRE